MKTIELGAVSRFVEADGRREIARIEASSGGNFDLKAFRRMVAAEKEAETWERIAGKARRLRHVAEGRALIQ